MVSHSAIFLVRRSTPLVRLPSVSLSMRAGFTPQIGDAIAIGLTTGTLFIIMVMLRTLSVITCCQETACNEHGQKGSQ
jgi:tRNA threonylcarbamoyladenosine modification (KEOPS) complex Cgi121 subunit